MQCIICTYTVLDIHTVLHVYGLYCVAGKLLCDTGLQDLVYTANCFWVWGFLFVHCYFLFLFFWHHHVTFPCSVLRLFSSCLVYLCVFCPVQSPGCSKLKGNARFFFFNVSRLLCHLHSCCRLQVRVSLFVLLSVTLFWHEKHLPLTVTHLSEVTAPHHSKLEKYFGRWSEMYKTETGLSECQWMSHETSRRRVPLMFLSVREKNQRSKQNQSQSDFYTRNTWEEPQLEAPSLCQPVNISRLLSSAHFLCEETSDITQLPVSSFTVCLSVCLTWEKVYTCPIKTDSHPDSGRVHTEQGNLKMHLIWKRHSGTVIWVFWKHRCTIN